MANENIAVAMEIPELDKLESKQLELIHAGLKGLVPAPLAFQLPSNSNKEIWELHGMFEPRVIEVIRLEGWFIDCKRSDESTLVVWRPTNIKVI